MTGALYYQIESGSKPHLYYDVRISHQRGHTCACPAFAKETARYMHPRCRHISAALAYLLYGLTHFGFEVPVSDDITQPVQIGRAIYDHDFVQLYIEVDKQARQAAHALGVPVVYLDDEECVAPEPAV